MKEIMDCLRSKPDYSKYFDFTKEPKIIEWSPEDDARNRILSAAKRIDLELPNLIDLELSNLAIILYYLGSVLKEGQYTLKT